MANKAVKLTPVSGAFELSFDDGKANVLNLDSLTALKEALEQARAGKYLILNGRDGMFSGGLDLKTLPKLSKEEFRSTLGLFASVCRTLLTYPRPTVAAVTGHAIAGGAVLMLCCDHRIGEDGPYKIGLPEVVMNMPVPSFVIELARRTTKRRYLNNVLLQGKLFQPQKAQEVGLLDQVASAGECLKLARATASELKELPSPAYEITKSRMTTSIQNALTTFKEELKYFEVQFDWQSVNR